MKTELVPDVPDIAWTWVSQSGDQRPSMFNPAHVVLTVWVPGRRCQSRVALEQIEEQCGA
jgi:hypothetical protein